MQSKTANKANNYAKKKCEQIGKNCLNLHATNFT